MTRSLRGLYGILDVDTLERLGLDLSHAAKALLAGGVRVLQLRAKERSAADTLFWLRTILPLARQAGVPLFANDRPDLAALVGVDGVHVGQDDVPASEVRRAFPQLRVGVSTHNLEQLTEALGAAPDYVALGPIFTTQSKKNPDPVVGLEMLGEAAVMTRRAGIPLVGIGGIDVTRAAAVVDAGAWPAVIGALMPADTGVGSGEAGAGRDGGSAYDEIRRRTEALSRAVLDASYRRRSGTA